MSIRLLSGLLALLLVSERGVQTTTVVPLTFSELARAADTIARVRVVDVSSSWRSQTSREQVITTHVVFDVERTLKGRAGSTLVLDFFGGRVGDVELSIDGTPRFVVGERCVLFVQDARVLSPIVGFMQGRFPISQSLDGTRTFVLTYDQRPFSATAQIGTAAPRASAAPVPAMSLDRFEQAVVSEVASGGR
jgi:hypothetical protein